MRIPVSQADWPDAFYSFSRFIRKEWPSDPVSLQKAYDVTAKLFGYDSLHDLSKSLVESVADKKVSSDDYSSSVAESAFRLYGIDPILMFDIVKKAPWKILTCYESTTEHHFLRARPEEVFFDPKGDIDLIRGKTPLLMQYLLDNEHIPKLSMAVTPSGDVYTASYTEKFTRAISNGLNDFAGLSQDQIDTYIAGLWRSIDNVFAEFDSSSKYVWNLPEYLDIVNLPDSRYLLKIDAFGLLAPGAYTAAELRDVIICLFKGNTLPAGDIDNIPLIDDRPVLKSKIGNQIYLSYKEIPQPFSMLSEQYVSSIFSKYKKPDSKTLEILENCAPDGAPDLFAFMTVVSERYENLSHDSYNNIAEYSPENIELFIKAIFSNSEIPYFKAEDSDSADLVEDLNEFEIQEYFELGSHILNNHPEFRDHFEPLYIGLEFKFSDLGSTNLPRNGLTICTLLSYLTLKSFGWLTGKGYCDIVSQWIENEISDSELSAFMSNMNRINQIYRAEGRNFSAMKSYINEKKLLAKHPQYSYVGEIYESRVGIVGLARGHSSSIPVFKY